MCINGMWMWMFVYMVKLQIEALHVAVLHQPRTSQPPAKTRSDKLNLIKLNFSGGNASLEFYVRLCE